MRIMVASDIHGSAFYCSKMLEAFNREKVDKLLLLGDLLYHGPRNDLPKEYVPKEVITMLNSIKDKIMCVGGNCDAAVDQMVLEFPVLADYCILYAGNRMIYATHGHIHNKKALPPMMPGDILLHGHTHIPVCEEIGDTKIIYMNPGSISIPKEGSEHSYMIITDELIQWKNLEGNIYIEYKLNS